jgi:glutaredoxin
MKVNYLLVALLFIAINVAQAGSLFRWVDKNGNVHYGDKPAEDAVATEQKKFSSPSAAGEDDLPYGIRKAKQDFPVTLFVTPSCGEGCAQARALLNKRGVPFVEKNVVTTADADALKAVSGGNGVPTITVGRTVLVGFEASQWNGELDIAGYPKVAPYGVRPVAPPTPKPEAPPATEQ